jgi:hypothetical protein
MASPAVSLFACRVREGRQAFFCAKHCGDGAVKRALSFVSAKMSRGWRAY